MLNKLTAAVLFVFALTGCEHGPSDRVIRSSVVKLASAKGSCSGTQIEAPSGKKYILSAAHCNALAYDGIIAVHTEDAGIYMSRVLEEDESSDLLLLEAAPGVPAIKIAKDISRFSSLRSFTHGNGYPTYKTSGSYIGEDVVQFEDYGVSMEKCTKKKNKIEKVNIWGIELSFCTVKVVGSITNVPAVPGSSGGLVVNNAGELAGVVSAGNESFTFLVTLKDINRFLEKR